MPRLSKQESSGFSTFLFLSFALGHVLADVRADPRLWGVHQLAFLPRAIWLLATLMLGALVLPVVARRLSVLA